MSEENGSRSWPKSWENLSRKVGSMSMARIPVSSTKDGELEVVGAYDCPQPDNRSQFEEFDEWAVQRLGDDESLDAYLSGVMVKIAQNIRSGAADPEKNKKKANEAASKLNPEQKAELLAQLQRELAIN